MKLNLKYSIYLVCSFSFSICLAQKKKELPKHEKEALQYTFTGNEDLLAGNVLVGEKDYRRAIAKDPNLMEPKYNLGYSSYKTNSFQEAADQFKQAVESAKGKGEKHAAYHNLGNAYMQMGDAEKAVEAYKNALRNNPTDDETRHNLALAKKKDEQQQQNKDQNKDQKNSQDKKDGKDKQNSDKNNEEDDKNSDKNKDKKDNKDGDKDDKKDKPEDKEGEDDKPEDKKDDKGDKDDDKEGDGDKENGKKPKPRQGQLSPEQAKSLLEAMQNQEKKVQDKMNAKKVRGPKVKSEKDW